MPLNKRMGTNWGNFFTTDYAFIEHVKGTTGTIGPVGAAYATGVPWNSDILDANGWPNSPDADARTFGGSFAIPSSTNFAGPYVIEWDGDGELQFNVGTWTTNAGLSSGYAEVSNGRWTGTDPRIVVTYTGIQQRIGIRVLRTDRSDTGAWFRNLRFFRLEDEADFDAGKVFRASYKQILVDANIGCIRYLGTTNNCKECRFENRKLPSYATYGQVSWLASLPYGDTTGTNQYALAGVTGTPASPSHGEIVTCRIPNGMVRGGAKTITGITKANPGVVTATSHGFNDGDAIFFLISAGMTQLNYKPCTVANKTADTFELSGVDTSAFSNFTAGTVMQYISLDVGGRGAYPVVFSNGTTPASNFSSSYIAANDVKTFYFDKYLVASTLVTGAWVFNDLGAILPHSDDVPWEIYTKLIVELAEMGCDANMWVCIPHWGMVSEDADYMAASNYGVGMVGVILNGANGYPGLPSQCDLIVEFSNETWNTSGSAFSHSLYLSRRGALRWGASGSGTTSFQTHRALLNIADINAAFPGEDRIHFVLGFQGTVGVAGGNAGRIAGNSFTKTDPRSDGGVSVPFANNAITYFDAGAFAGYFLAGSTFDTANLTTLASNYAAATTDADREEICSTYVDGVVSSGNNENLTRYRDTLLPAYATEMTNNGKVILGYESGWDKNPNGTAEVNTFLAACKRSAAWARAYSSYYKAFKNTTGAYQPTLLSLISDRWGHAPIDLYSSGVEGGALDEAWDRLALLNNGRYRMDVTLT